MIKKWKLFLENSNDEFESEFRKLAEELKTSLIRVFSKFFIGEHLLRSTGGDVDQYLEQGVIIILEQLLNSFDEILSSRNIDEETCDEIMKLLYDSAMVSKSIMIKKSFKDGIVNLVDKFTELLIQHIKKKGNEGEEWRQPQTVEYKDLSKSEIQKLIDDTFDNRDKNPNWKKELEFYTSLPNYLKESNEYVDSKSEFEKACKEAAEILVNFCLSILKVK